MPASPQPGGLTTAETRLAERYVSVLDHVSRCALAVDGGDCFYLWDKAAALAEAAERLAAEASRAAEAERRGAPTPRPAAVRAAVARFGRHYHAARLLHPAQPPEGGAGS